MTFLPIVERELRVTARKAATYWTRVLAATVVLVIAGGVLGVTRSLQGWMPQQAGPILFGILKWLSFVVAATAGVFLTADCLSEEKREGTLGLLFLTDLRGHDVALGKLLASSLRAVYALVAVFPVFGLAVLLGGVTGAEFWKSLLVLLNALFFSLAAGLWVSSTSRDTLKAMSRTAGWCALFFVVPPVLEALPISPLGIPFSLASPSYGVLDLKRPAPSHFWINLALVQAIGWGFIGLAGYHAARTWQEKPVLDDKRRQHGPSEKWRRSRKPWLERSPVGWLSSRDRWLGGEVRGVVFGGAGLVVLATRLGERGMGFAFLLVYAAALMFELWLAVQASRFVTESRRAGLLELLLASPLTVEEILTGHWWGLRRLFLPPAVVLLAMLATGHVLQLGTLSGVNLPNTGSLLAFQIVGQVMSLISFVTGLGALGWFGIWMGLTSRSTTAAVLKTILFVKVLPLIILVFAQSMLTVALLVGRGASSQWATWLALWANNGLGIAVDLAFIIISRRQVQGNFRRYVSDPGGLWLTWRRSPRPLSADTSLPSPAS